jgi:hypothetical protein
VNLCLKCVFYSVDGSVVANWEANDCCNFVRTKLCLNDNTILQGVIRSISEVHMVFKRRVLRKILGDS